MFAPAEFRPAHSLMISPSVTPQEGVSFPSVSPQHKASYFISCREKVPRIYFKVLAYPEALGSNS